MPTTLLLALSLAAPNLKDKPKAEPSVVGEWEVESITVNGRQSTTTPGLNYVFTKDGKWQIFRDGQETSATLARGFTMDAKASPPTVDLITNTAAANGSRLEGIFKVEGDTLTICRTRQKGAERPTKFESPEGSQITLYVL